MGYSYCCILLVGLINYYGGRSPANRTAVNYVCTLSTVPISYRLCDRTSRRLRVHNYLQLGIQAFGSKFAISGFGTNWNFSNRQIQESWPFQGKNLPWSRVLKLYNKILSVFRCMLYTNGRRKPELVILSNSIENSSKTSDNDTKKRLGKILSKILQPTRNSYVILFNATLEKITRKVKECIPGLITLIMIRNYGE